MFGLIEGIWPYKRRYPLPTTYDTFRGYSFAKFFYFLFSLSYYPFPLCVFAFGVVCGSLPVRLCFGRFCAVSGGFTVYVGVRCVVYVSDLAVSLLSAGFVGVRVYVCTFRGISFDSGAFLCVSCVVVA